MADTKQRAAIQAAIKAIIGGVTGIDADQVFDGSYETIQPQDYLDKFKNSAGSIEAWLITRVNTRTESSETMPGRIANQELVRAHQFKIEGHQAVIAGAGHASEDAFQNVIDSLLMAFDGLFSINGSAYSSHPPQVTVINFMTFGDVLCHHATIEILATEWIGGFTPS